MNSDQLRALAKAYEENHEFITNEETAKMALIVPFLRALGYNPNSPREVRAEYSAEFTQGDGKKLADRMDYAVFDQAGERPLFVVEAKPLGADLIGKSNQLARYIAQMKGLRFGLMTDGCHYLFFGDLSSPNVMDDEPFFVLDLSNAETDWDKSAKFLSRFSRDKFNAQTLAQDAENSRYRKRMVARLKHALTNPESDTSFVRWLTDDGVYEGKRTNSVLDRMGRLAKESIEPALMSVLSENFLDALKMRLPNAGAPVEGDDAESGDDAAATADSSADEDGIVTTAEEIEFHRFVQGICERSGQDPASILYRDTRSYFNVSYRKPTRWFLRLYADSKRKFLVTRLDASKVSEFARGFKVQDSSIGWQIEIEDVAQVWALEPLVLASLNALESGGKPAEGPVLDAEVSPGS